MDRWKAEMGRVREEKRRRKKLKKRKSQKKEDSDARKGRKVANRCVFPMICGSGGSKSRLAKAVGAEPLALNPSSLCRYCSFCPCPCGCCFRCSCCFCRLSLSFFVVDGGDSGSIGGRRFGCGGDRCNRRSSSCRYWPLVCLLLFLNVRWICFYMF